MKQVGKMGIGLIFFGKLELEFTDSVRYPQICSNCNNSQVSISMTKHWDPQLIKKKLLINEGYQFYIEKVEEVEEFQWPGSILNSKVGT